MDKRKIENQRVKRSIANTLFSLMQKKSLSEISITELVSGAQVARASFYRNYNSKEDILVTLIRDVLDECRKELILDGDTFYTYENISTSFRFFGEYRSYILDLCRSGFSSLLLEELNLFHESIEGNMPSSSIDKYELYIYIGALYNTAITWLLDDMKVPVNDLSRYFLSIVSGMFH